MPTINAQKGTKINAYKVSRTAGTPIIEFVSEDQSSRTAALDVARGVARAFNCCIFVFNTKTQFMWVTFQNGNVQSVGTSRKDSFHG